jgi:hypothetical protein
VKFFTVKQLLFVLVVLTALSYRWLGLPHWHGEGPCLVLQPGAITHVRLLPTVLALC